MVTKVWLQFVSPTSYLFFSFYEIQRLENGQNRLNNRTFKLHHKGHFLSKSADVQTSDIS
jgi:hypothetical protein